MLNNVGNKTLDARILEMLKNENGFSTDELGTYFYKDVIKYVVYSILDIRTNAYNYKKQVLDMDMSLLINSQNECIISKDDLYFSIYKQRKDVEDSLKEQLESYHSSTYFYIASKINDIDLCSFHKNIQKAAFKTRLVREKKEYENNYMVLAFGLGECILIAIENDLVLECNLLNEKIQQLEEKLGLVDSNELKKELELLRKQYVKKEKLKNILASARDEDISKIFVSSSKSRKR